MKTQRSGFTLVELLVVITIIGILMGLLIPAVNAARETARRNECSTRVKNLALAAIQYENTKGELPGYLQSFGVYQPPASGAADPSDPTATTAPPIHNKLGTWTVALLPWLDAQPTYEHWTEDRYPIVDAAADGEFSPTSFESGFGNGFHPLSGPNLAILQCASNPNDDSSFGRNSFVANNGMHHLTVGGSPVNTISFAESQDRPNGAFNNKHSGLSTAPVAVGPAVRLDDFKDGQGNTILFTENVQALPWNLPGFIDASALTTTAPSFEVGMPSGARFAQGVVWHFEDPDAANAAMTAWVIPATADASITAPAAVLQKHRINGGGATVSEDIFVERMTAANAPSLARPSSAHTDGVNTGMADGGTRFITDSIDYRVYQALLTLRGKASDVPWPEFILDDDAY